MPLLLSEPVGSMRKPRTTPATSSRRLGFRGCITELAGVRSGAGACSDCSGLLLVSVETLDRGAGGRVPGHAVRVLSATGCLRVEHVVGYSSGDGRVPPRPGKLDSTKVTRRVLVRWKAQLRVRVSPLGARGTATAVIAGTGTCEVWAVDRSALSSGASSSASRRPARRNRDQRRLRVRRAARARARRPRDAEPLHAPGFDDALRVADAGEAG
jgi:hypothetical protein